MSKVNVCIPTYNGEKYLAETLISALNQTYPDFNIIISDDGSSDKTLAIAESFQNKYSDKIVILRHQQYGLTQNWNFCIDQSDGKYIKFLFQDDLLEPECLREMVQLAEQDHEIGMVFSPRKIFLDEGAESDKDCIFIYQEILDVHKAWSDLKPIQPGFELLSDPGFFQIPINKIGEPSTVLIKKKVFKKIEMFDSKLFQLMDIDMWFRIMGYYKIGFVNKNLSSFRIHPHQQTKKNISRKENSFDNLRLHSKMLCHPAYFFLDSNFRKNHIQALVRKFSVKKIKTLLRFYCSSY